jgi:hypothetical protein
MTRAENHDRQRRKSLVLRQPAGLPARSFCTYARPEPEEGTMTKFGLIATIAVGGVAIGATALASSPTPFQPAPAQVRAERSCGSEGVSPASAAWELCLAHATRAYEWGEPALARQLAHIAREAHESCLDEGQRVESPAFSDCIGREMDARSDLLILGDDENGENVATEQ